MCNGNAPSDSWREAWDPSYLRSASVSSKTLPNARGRVPCTARKLCSRVGVSALVKARPQKIKVKQWLDHQFEIGERDKTKKAKPEEVAKRMKTLKNDANAYVFLPSERLGVSQIRAHFAACARSRRTAIQGQLVANSLQSIYQATPSIASMVPPSFNSRNCWIPLLPQPHQDSRDMRTNANECQLPSSESACDPPSKP